MKRPTFFVSSTIYDFRDLRSSLKFYLEEQGCKVLNRPVYENSPKSRPRLGPTINIDTMKLAMFLHLMDRWANVIDLSRAILQHLDGAPYQQPSLRPSSPIHGMEEQLVEERLTKDEIDTFIYGGVQ